MTEKTLTTENIRPALDALRGELAPWPVVAKKQDRLNTAQLNAANSGITSSLVAQIIANTAAIRALESAITGTGLRALVVASLPAVGTTGILYIVPVTTYDPDTDADVVNYSNEYIWIPVEGGQASEGHYEQVGQTGIVINNGQLTITVNDTSVGTFTANQSGDTTAAITVPTNADYVDRTTDQTVAGVKTFSSTISGTASKAIADEDGTSIKSGYVNVAGNQTVTGQKTWTDTQSFKDSAYTQGVSVTDRKQDIWNITDSTDTAFGTWEAIQYTDGRQGFRLCTSNKYKNGTLDPTGNIVPVYFEFLQRPEDGSTILTWTNGFIGNSVYPIVPNTYTLGNVLFQWSSVYAQSYFYNGTAWGLDQNNKWTGTNTFTSILNQNINSIYSEIPSSDHFAVKGITDNNGDNVFAISFADRSSGQRDLTLRVYNTDGTQQGVGLYKNSDNSSDFKPMSNAQVNLGAPSNQWSSVYAQSYYYNGTEFLNKFVTTDTNQEIGGTKAFTGSIRPYGLITHLNQSLEKGTIPSTNKYGGIIYSDKTFANNVTHRFADQVALVDSSGTSAVSLSAYKWEANSQLKTVLELGYPLQGNTFLRLDTDEVIPGTTAATDLGTSTNKWKSLNGINPGALSLPDNSNAINLDTTNWGVSGELNHYAPTINGWLCISVKGGANNGLFLMDTSSGFGQSCYGNANETVAGRIKVALPVIASRDVLIIIHADSNSDIYEAKLYPCLGNV